MSLESNLNFGSQSANNKTHEEKALHPKIGTPNSQALLNNAARENFKDKDLNISHVLPTGESHKVETKKVGPDEGVSIYCKEDNTRPTGSEKRPRGISGLGNRARAKQSVKKRRFSLLRHAAMTAQPLFSSSELLERDREWQSLNERHPWHQDDIPGYNSFQVSSLKKWHFLVSS